MFGALDEVLVSETLSVFGVSRLVKVVHVELADKRREVVVFEVAWQHTLCELVCFVHHEAIAIGVPLHGRVIFRVLDREKLK